MGDAPTRLASALEGRYRIERKLGEGGMAEVYLAADLRHDRQVAIKLLRPELAAVVGAERFLAEIRTTANLQHPHILPLFDSGEAAGLLYYVMPYVQGESLAVRLERERQLPVAEAIRIAGTVAGALEHAHGQGVIHRDIKPANILLQGGQAVVADFGIALAVSHSAGGRITETGLSLGTPHYMSPEQATGEKTLDARTDVYALGCVLYEMLAGEPPYSGTSAQAVLAKILTEDPRPVSAARRSVPANVEAAVSKAMEKIPADRFSSAEAFGRALEDPGFRHDAVQAGPLRPGTPRRRNAATQAPIWKEPAFLGVGALAVIATALAVWGWTRSSDAPSESFAFREELEVPSGGASGRELTISESGTIAVVGRNQEGRSIYLRAPNDLGFRPLRGTEGGLSPEFSPDGGSIAFIRGDSIFRIGVDGGLPQRVTTFSPGGAGGVLDWTSDGSIYFTSAGAIHRVADTGGPSHLIVAPLTSDSVYRWPHLLPDGRGLLFTAYGPDRAEPEIRLLEQPGGNVSTLIGGIGAYYVRTGHLVYGHRTQQLLAVPFDLRRLEVTGLPVSIQESVYNYLDNALQFDVNRRGDAVYIEGRARRRDLVLFDRTGELDVLDVEPGVLFDPRFSPTGRWLAFRRDNSLEVHDLMLGGTRRLTPGRGGTYPVWSRGSDTLTYKRGTEVVRLSLEGRDSAESLFPVRGDFGMSDWTGDGRLLAARTGQGTGRDLVVASFSGGEANLDPYLEANWNESAPRLSPDGRWVAYMAERDGSWKVYVRSFPEPGLETEVSEGPGSQPVWAPGGGTLYYREGTAILAAVVRTQQASTLESRDTVLNEASVILPDNSFFPQFDVHPDGQRLVVVRARPEEALPGSTSQIVVVLNWLEELKAKVAAETSANDRP